MVAGTEEPMAPAGLMSARTLIVSGDGSTAAGTFPGAKYFSPIKCRVLMLRNKRKPWTDDEDRRLLQLRANGRSPVSIAAALNRSFKAITVRLDILRARQRSEKKEAVLSA